MTVRSVVLGLLGVVLLAALTYFNDLYLKNTYLSASFFPVSVVGVLVLFVVLVNPLLRRISTRLALGRGEIATIFALLLFSVYVPSRGLGHNFTSLLMLPHHYERTQPGWQAGEARLTPADVPDAAALAAAMDAPGAPEPVRARRPGGFAAPAAGGRWTPDAEAALLAWANAVIAGADLEPAGADLPPHLRVALTVPLADRTPLQRARLTRAALEQAFPGLIRTRRAGVMELVPPRMLADPSANPADLDGFVTGMGSADQPFGFRDVPWRAWARPLRFWLPVILTFVLASIGLALVVHRQWTHHEHLPFPTMEFARSLLPAADGSPSPILRSRPFWIGLAAVAAIHLNNYLNVWWPNVIPINLRFDFLPLVELVPTLRQGWGWWTAFYPTVYFTVVGLAFFLSNDVSLSLGLAPYVFALISGAAAGYGISTGGNRLHPHVEGFMNSGAYAGLFVMLIHSGRHYFRAAFGRGLGIPMRERVEPHAVWGARAAMLGFALMVVQIAGLGVEWPYALLYTFWLLLVPLVTGRMLAESGVFFINPRTYACAMLWGVFGVSALGRQPLLVLALFTMVLLIHSSLSVLPFAVSSFRIADVTGVKVGRVAVGGLAAVAVALAVMVPFNLRLQYRHGAFAVGDSWTSQFVPRAAFDDAVFTTRQLESQGVLEASDAWRGAEKLRHAAPRLPSVGAFGITFALVLLFGFARHRFARWPLHPVMFAVFAVWPSQYVGFSFLLGWLVKSFVMKYGGARLYQAAKPLMIGLVAGELIGVLVPTIASLVYYAVTGQRAPAYSILPG